MNDEVKFKPILPTANSEIGVAYEEANMTRLKELSIFAFKKMVEEQQTNSFWAETLAQFIIEDVNTILVHKGIEIDTDDIREHFGLPRIISEVEYTEFNEQQ